MSPMKPEPRRRDPGFAGTLSLAQVARRWQISVKEVRRMLGKQQLAFVQIRGSLRVPLAEVQRFERVSRVQA
jgi:hypothetical protein